MNAHATESAWTALQFQYNISNTEHPSIWRDAHMGNMKCETGWSWCMRISACITSQWSAVNLSQLACQERMAATEARHGSPSHRASSLPLVGLNSTSQLQRPAVCKISLVAVHPWQPGGHFKWALGSGLTPYRNAAAFCMIIMVIGLGETG